MLYIACMDTAQITDSKRRFLNHLKRFGPSTAGGLAEALGMTDVAVRQHLGDLEQQGLVAQEPQTPKGRGRPAVLWSLAEAAQGLFPDRHGELTVGLIEAMREALGAEGLQRVIDVRAREQIAAYQEAMPAAKASLKKRVEALASRRTAEGYMAEVISEEDGSYLLIEHNCPICDAAKCCVGLCSAELQVFQEALGSDVTIDRTEHLLSDGRRCVYRISNAT